MLEEATAEKRPINETEMARFKKPAQASKQGAALLRRLAHL
jgi:hypothetical protein